MTPNQLLKALNNEAIIYAVKDGVLYSSRIKEICYRATSKNYVILHNCLIKFMPDNVFFNSSAAIKKMRNSLQI